MVYYATKSGSDSESEEDNATEQNEIALKNSIGKSNKSKPVSSSELRQGHHKTESSSNDKKDSSKSTKKNKDQRAESGANTQSKAKTNWNKIKNKVRSQPDTISTTNVERHSSVIQRSQRQDTTIRNEHNLDLDFMNETPYIVPRVLYQYDDDMNDVCCVLPTKRVKKSRQGKGASGSKSQTVQAKIVKRTNKVVRSNTTDQSKPAAKKTGKSSNASRPSATKQTRKYSNASRPSAASIPRKSSNASQPSAASIPEQSSNASRPFAASIPRKSSNASQPSAASIPRKSSNASPPPVPPRPSGYHPSNTLRGLSAQGSNNTGEDEEIVASNPVMDTTQRPSGYHPNNTLRGLSAQGSNNTGEDEEIVASNPDMGRTSLAEMLQKQKTQLRQQKQPGKNNIKSSKETDALRNRIADVSSNKDTYDALFVESTDSDGKKKYIINQNNKVMGWIQDLWFGQSTTKEKLSAFNGVNEESVRSYVDNVHKGLSGMDRNMMLSIGNNIVDTGDLKSLQKDTMTTDGVLDFAIRHVDTNDSPIVPMLTQLSNFIYDQVKDVKGQIHEDNIMAIREHIKGTEILNDILINLRLRINALKNKNTIYVPFVINVDQAHWYMYDYYFNGHDNTLRSVDYFDTTKGLQKSTIKALNIGLVISDILANALTESKEREVHSAISNIEFTNKSSNQDVMKSIELANMINRLYANNNNCGIGVIYNIFINSGAFTDSMKTHFGQEPGALRDYLVMAMLDDNQ